jgi:hypothetical protein
MRLEIATKNRLWRLQAKINASAINSHLKPKVKPRYFVTFQAVG